MLTQATFPAESALQLIAELQDNIYSHYPKIKDPAEDESLTGAKMYISEISQKYNSLNSQERDHVDHREVEPEIVVSPNGAGSPERADEVADMRQRADDLATKVKHDVSMAKLDNERPQVVSIPPT